MTEFWQSDLGEVTGKAEDAFTKAFVQIPDNTTAIAKINAFKFVSKNENNLYHEIDWQIISGEFKNQHVFQKLKTFDADNKKRHKALNMLKYLYNLFQITLKHNNTPTTEDLKPFIGKNAGIRIQEWSMPKKDGSGMMEGNFVSEVKPAADYKSETGVKAKYVTPVESALTRNPGRMENMTLEDSEIPF